MNNSTWLGYPATAPGTNYTSNTLNQYSALTTVGVGTVTPTYDANGNLTGDGTFTFGYDSESRLVSASGSGVTAAYAFDAHGRRKSRTVNGTTTVSVTDAGRVASDASVAVGASIVGYSAYQGASGK